MNYMEQVANMLGVELDEEFKVEEYDDDYTFKLTKDGLYWRGDEGWHSGYFNLTDINLTDILCGRIEIIKNPILDAKEKEYLSNVIKPFRDCVKYIFKYDSPDYEYIVIEYYDKLTEEKCKMFFPCFEKDAMYKGMQLYENYKLEELGL